MPDSRRELASELDHLEPLLAALRVEHLLSGELDQNNAIFAIHPGAGGTESQDWAQMLLRMYVRWAEGQGFKVETLDLGGRRSQVKSATIAVTGPYAYGYLKAEAGVHRLVRISPVRCQQAPAYVLCLGLRVSRVERRPRGGDRGQGSEDRHVSSGGAGGQNVNKVETAIASPTCRQASSCSARTSARNCRIATER